MRTIAIIGALCLASCVFAAEEEGFVPLFNGKDLAGWVNANCAPETWSVKDGMICCTGKPTGALRTDRQYENFILEVEWRHLSKGGNSGVFIWGTPIAAPGVPFLRGIEVQVLDHGYAENYEKQTGKKSDWFTTHGDVFPIHGATMKPFGQHKGQRSFPSEERSKRSPEWNHYRIVCDKGVIRLSVNGKEVSGGEECNYRKGYLALESEGAPVEFRNIRIKELPTSNTPAELTAPLDQGWRPLFTGLDLRGWKTSEAVEKRWSARGERLALAAAPGVAGADATLWTQGEFGDAEFVMDVAPAKPAAGQAAVAPVVEFRGAKLTLDGLAPGSMRRITLTAQGGKVTVAVNDKPSQAVELPAGAPAKGPLGLAATGGAMTLMNLYVRELGR